MSAFSQIRHARWLARADGAAMLCSRRSEIIYDVALDRSYYTLV